jgi:hypothetical protein
MKSRLNHTKFSTVLASFVVLLVPAGGICAGKNHVCNRQFGEVHPEYLKAVKAYADAIIRDGRDTYGDVKSPLLVTGGIDLKTHQFVRRELKGQGIREGDRAYGTNPHHDLNLYQILYALADLTGDKKYENEADNALRWFFKNCRSPATGLFAWGEHLHWDVTAEACRGRDLHEFYRPWVLWGRSFELAPKACEAFANGRYTGRGAGATSRGTRGFILRRGGTRIRRRRIRSS